MVHLAPLIRDLALILGIAGLTGYVFKKINQPVVLGYLLAGFIIGPHTTRIPLVTDLPNIQTWAELGVIFVMFSLGLDFSFRKLVRVGPSAFVTTVGEVLFMLMLGYGAGVALGWKTLDCFFLGGILAISSTTIIFKTFDELGLRTRQFAERVFAILVVEDVVAVLLLVGLTVVAMTQTVWDLSLLTAAIKLAAVVGSWFLIGYFVIPSLMRRTARSMDNEGMIVLAIGLCLLLVVAATSLGYSSALGAFIMGSILAETPEAARIERLIQPVRHLFSAVFFVSVGMLVDPAVIRDNPGTIAFVTVTLIGGKIVGATVSALASGQTLRSSIQIGFSLSQIGEFSFIIATLGSQLRVTSDFLYTVAVAVSGITAFTTPFFVRHSGPTADWVSRRLPAQTQDILRRYSSWMQSPPSKDSQGPSLRPGLFRFALNGLVVSLLFLAFSRWGLVWLERFLPESDALALVAWGVTVAIAAPFVWGMFFAFQSNSQWEPRVLAVPAFFAHLGTVFWFGFLSSTFFATTLEFVLTLSLALGLFLLFYQRLERAYRGLERHLLGNIGPPEPLGPDPLNTLAPWDLHLVRVALNPNSPLCGQTLAESAIRQRFGVNVVAIQRAESCVTAPRASHLLFPHDELLILGTDAQLDAFRPVALGENAPTPAQAPDFSLQQVLVQQDSDLAGKTIRDSGIRQSLKGLIVGLENGPFRTTNPDPQRILTPGDILWVVREAV